MFVIATMIISHIVHHLEISVVYYDICRYGIDSEAYECDTKSKDCYVSNVLKEFPASHIES